MGAATDVLLLGAELQDCREACDHSGVMQQVLLNGAVKGCKKVSPKKRAPDVTQAPSWVISGQQEERWQPLGGELLLPITPCFSQLLKEHVESQTWGTGHQDSPEKDPGAPGLL